MSTLDYGPIEDFHVSHGNGVEAPYEPSVLLFAGDADGEMIANLTHDRARKLAYAILHQVECGAEHSEDLRRHDQLVAAGVFPPRPTSRAALTLA